MDEEVQVSNTVLAHIEMWARMENRSRDEIIAELIHLGAASKIVQEQRSIQ